MQRVVCRENIARLQHAVAAGEIGDRAEPQGICVRDDEITDSAQPQNFKRLGRIPRRHEPTAGAEPHAVMARVWRKQ